VIEDPQLDPPSGFGPGRLRGFLSRPLVRAGLAGYVFTALILAVNLLTGIVTARALGPDGRGVTTAIVMVTQMAGVVAALGAGTALSYFAARAPESAAQLMSTWALVLLPMAVLALVGSELLLPTLFGAQDHHTLWLGRIFLFNIALVLWGSLNNGLLLGLHDFFVFNGLRFLQPALHAAVMLVLWLAGALTVELALITWTVTQGVVLAIGTVRLLRRVGVARPDLGLARRSVAYGIRAHGDALAGSLNTRLDLVILPAYVAATGLGLYSIAANLSLIINQLAGSLSTIILPAAARDQAGGPRKIVLSLQATLALATVGALVLFVAAELLLRVIYGEAFTHATDTLRILLPGTVLYAGSTVLAAGLHGAGYPLRATLGQVAGGVVTVAGLIAFVPSGGINAAAAVSTTAYATVFVLNLVAYRRTAGLPWRAFLRP
jgi:antigen flippase